MIALYATCTAVVLGAGIEQTPYRTWTRTVIDTSPVDPVAAAQPEKPGIDLSDLPQQTLPYRQISCRLQDSQGRLWLGSPHGLMLHQPNETRVHLFHSRRWLPSDYVVALSEESPDRVVVRTTKGTVRFQLAETTLSQKIDRIETQLRSWHVREGLVGAIVTNEPAAIESGYVQPSDDNDGLWTSLSIAAQAFRYGVTNDPAALADARRSLRALMFLEQVTGIPGFAARSWIPASEDAQRYGGQWHRSPEHGVWWKGDTSSDELDGHYFAYAVYFDLCADEPEKEAIRQVVGRITDHILDHGFYYVGPSGKPTRWGVWAPEKLNHDLAWIGDRGLNSLEILSHLAVAHHICKSDRYRRAYEQLIEEHAYAINTVRQKILFPPDQINHSDDELAFLAYYPLLQYERSPDLRAIYRASIERSWQIERPEGSPLFNFIYAASRQADTWLHPGQRPDRAYVDPESYDREACLQWFREVPEDLWDWRIDNRGRQDLAAGGANRFGESVSLRVLPVSERPLMRWNGDPYRLDGGGDGRRRDDGTFVLLPYWLGRWHRFFD